MNKVLSIISLLSVLWSNILAFIILDGEYFSGRGFWEILVGACLIYSIVLLYNIFVIFYCRKVQGEQHTSKIPIVISKAGTVLYSIVAIFMLFFFILGEVFSGV